MGYIYLLREPTTNVVRYVGQTIRSPKGRLQEHLRKACREPVQHLHFWLATLSESPVLEVIETLPEDKLDIAEQFWIAYYRKQGVRLCNETAGGRRQGAFRGPHSEATKARMSASLKGRVTSEETRKKLSIASKGRVLTPEHKAKIREAHLRRKSDMAKAKAAYSWEGKSHSLETRQLMSANRKGKPWSAARRAAHEASKGSYSGCTPA